MMVNGIGTVILVEIGELTFKITNLNLNQIGGNLRIELDLIEERREVASVRNAILKRKITTIYNKKIITRAFVECNLSCKELVLEEKITTMEN